MENLLIKVKDIYKKSTFSGIMRSVIGRIRKLYLFTASVKNSFIINVILRTAKRFNEKPLHNAVFFLIWVLAGNIIFIHMLEKQQSGGYSRTLKGILLFFCIVLYFSNIEKTVFLRNSFALRLWKKLIKEK